MDEPLTPPGWYPDPGGRDALRWFDGSVWTGHLATRRTPAVPGSSHLNADFALDRAVADDLDSGVRWGLGQAIWAYAVVFIASVPLGILQVAGVSTTALTLPGEMSLGVGAWLVGRRVARERGGWFAAFGLSAPERSDLKPAATFVLLQLLARIVVGAALVAAFSSLRDQKVTNIPVTHGYAAAVVVQLVIGVVIVAPIVEETQFRGIILRAAMRKWNFGISAAINAVAFGSLHALEGTSGLSALTLGVMMTVFGYLQCVVVRRTGRLAPAMIVHGVANGLALALALG